MAAAISTQGLTKIYYDIFQKAEIMAVNDLNLEVEEGEIFGFLGRNGAGKTTTIKMLLGLIFPTNGSATVLDRPCGDIEVKKQVSYLPESPYFYETMTGQDLLFFYGKLFRIPDAELTKRVATLLKDVGLETAGGRNLRGYSKGMLQRIGIAQSLINDPKLLFLDEPTSGLDPIAHAEMRDLIVNVGRGGKTVFLSSHQLSDVEQVCTRVAIIHRGKLLSVGRLDDLLSGEEIRLVAQGIGDGIDAKLKQLTQTIERTDGQISAILPDQDAVSTAIDLIRAEKGQIVSITPHKRSLEEVFVNMVRQEEGL